MDVEAFPRQLSWALCSLGRGHITSCHGSKTYCLIFLYRYHWRSLFRPAETMGGGGGSCGRFPFPVNNWKASTLLSGADFAKTTPGCDASNLAQTSQNTPLKSII